jgi:hypothetical protein
MKRRNLSPESLNLMWTVGFMCQTSRTRKECVTRIMYLSNWSKPDFHLNKPPSFTRSSRTFDTFFFYCIWTISSAQKHLSCLEEPVQHNWQGNDVNSRRIWSNLVVCWSASTNPRRGSWLRKDPPGNKAGHYYTTYSTCNSFLIFSAGKWMNGGLKSTRKWCDD